MQSPSDISRSLVRPPVQATKRERISVLRRFSDLTQNRKVPFSCAAEKGRSRRLRQLVWCSAVALAGLSTSCFGLFYVHFTAALVKPKKKSQLCRASFTGAGLCCCSYFTTEDARKRLKVTFQFPKQQMFQCLMKVDDRILPPLRVETR